jgi:polyhydroxybutyrate depolymerase
MKLQRHRLLAISMILSSIVFLVSCQHSTVVSTSSGTNAPTASTGCGKPAPTSPGTTTTQSLSSDGIERTFRLHVPAGYQPDHATALVLNFHGLNSNATQQESYSRFSDLADREHFLVVYPNGTSGSGKMQGWATGGVEDPHNVDDVRFTNDLLDTLQHELCIDAHRIYSTGISNGGGMTNLLACRLANRIAAFAPVAGAFYTTIGECQPGRAVPIIEFHGTSDPLVFYEGRPLVKMPAIQTWLQEWSTRDGCTGGPDTFFQQADVMGEQWTGCQTNSAVIHYRIDGGGHTWPGAQDVMVLGATTHTIDATSLIWQFFQKYHLA